MRTWCLYMHTHKANGKKYIGITQQKLTKRWKNGLGYVGSPHFWAAIKKYGWDAFHHEVLYEGLSQADAEALEIELIAKHRTTERKFGYNAAPGGNTTKGYIIPEQGRRNISEAHKGGTHTEEVRAKMSEARRGQNNNFYGRHHALDAIEANVRAHGGHPILCVETGVVYVSLGEAERLTGINRYQISGCCHNKPSCKTAGGFRWRFADTTITTREEENDGQ